MTSAVETSPGPIALVGSGEFLPQMVEVDRFLLTGRRPRAAFLPTAAGEEGSASIRRWLQLGADHYTAMGIEPVAVPVLTAEDANDPSFAAMINDVGLIYLSGGNPGYIAKTLRDSLVWDAIVAGWRAGAALAGCSAGAIAFTSTAPNVRGGHMVGDERATNLVSHLAVIPHFDQIGRWNPGFLSQARARLDPGRHLVGVDEDTALVGGLTEWTVMGRLTVSVFGPDGPTVYTHGQTVSLPF